MPTLRLSPEEAKALKRRRLRNKAHNTAIYAVVERIKRRLKKADALETAIINNVLQDVRSMAR